MDSEPVNNPLFDIAPPRGKVTIADKDYDIVGVPFRVVMAVAKEAPGVLAFFIGGTLDLSTLEKSPDAVAAIIAAGFGAPDDERVKNHAADLPLDIQLELFAAILKQSTGGGAVPFAAKLKALQNALNPPATEAPRPLRFKMREPGTPPELSNSSLPVAESANRQFGT